MCAKRLIEKYALAHSPVIIALKKMLRRYCLDRFDRIINVVAVARLLKTTITLNQKLPVVAF
jgi:hypothetical protein